METSKIHEVQYDTEAHHFILILENGDSIIYDTTHGIHAIRVKKATESPDGEPNT